MKAWPSSQKRRTTVVRLFFDHVQMDDQQATRFLVELQKTMNAL